MIVTEGMVNAAEKASKRLFFIWSMSPRNVEFSKAIRAALEAALSAALSDPTPEMIHTAEVWPSAKIMEGASIGARASIGYRASIGAGATIGARATIGVRASIDARASIGAGAALGERVQYEKDDWLFVLGPQGSRGAWATAVYSHIHGLRWWVGCTHGITTDKLRALILETHGDTEHAADYLHAIHCVETHPGLKRAMSKAGEQ